MSPLVERVAQAPAFGQADLGNCEREQIHLAGSIQPHGALLLLRLPDLVIVQTSANAGAFIGLRGSVLGRPVSALPGDLAERIAPHLSEALDQLPAALRCRIGPARMEFDVMLHRPPGGGLIVELERAGPPGLSVDALGEAIRRIRGAVSLRALCDEAARVFREITLHDRVMIYRFDEIGHGEVIAEEREPALEAFLGNRYPATDIPQIARRLYERNRVRVLADIGYAPVPLTPALSPITGRELDMSLCMLRSISPIHVQYLKNMGVSATLVASIMVGGRLWGLVSCHHHSQRLVPYGTRAVAELIAEALATRVAALESFALGQAELAVRRLEQRMIETISRKGDWRSALFDGAAALLGPVGADGAALLFEGEVLTTGEVPGTPQLRAVAGWLEAQAARTMHVSASFAAEQPLFAGLRSVASGLLAIPVGDAPGGYLMWFRPERVRTVTWGGNPEKAVVVGNDPRDLSPRRSFAQWHQLVEGTSEPWSQPDLAAARLIGESVNDVVLQFRAVRTLVAQDQLAQVRDQVASSVQPVLLGDAGGQVILMNAALTALLGAPLAQIGDLPARCVEREEVGRRLTELLREGRIWRGEVTLSGSPSRPLMIRADPVYASPERPLGFVLLFTDLTERKAGEAARRQFQDGLVMGHRRLAAASPPDPTFRMLLSSLEENAQLAGLEIADGVDLAQVAEMLDSVRQSTTRAAEILARLLRHSHD